MDTGRMELNWTSNNRQSQCAPPRRPTYAINITAWQLQLRVTSSQRYMFDLYFAHSTSSLFKPTTTAAVGAKLRGWPAPQHCWCVPRYLGVSAWQRPVLGSPWSLAVVWMDGRSPGLLGGESWLCFKHPVVRCPVLGTDLRSSAVLTLSLTTPHLPPWAAHQLFVRRITCSRSGTKNVPRPDRIDAVPGQNSTRNGSVTITNK